MKIRISGNSIRLRLSQREVTDIVDGKTVASACKIGHATFRYHLSNTDQQSIFATYTSDTLTVYLPTFSIGNWETNEVVGFDHTDENGLFILVEKDFQCLKPRESEDESDLYINPLA